VIKIQDQISYESYVSIYEIVIAKARLINRKIRFTNNFLDMLKKHHPSFDRSVIVYALKNLCNAKKESLEFLKEQRKLNPKTKKSKIKKPKRTFRKSKGKSKIKGNIVSSIYGSPTSYGKPIYNLPRT
ncbi:MAG TPA: hypothetical protein VN451_11005, partial [Chitinophagaceae bacterium]|nr:hypothetical protein [Chitinophagaceae bacterium]